MGRGGHGRRPYNPNNQYWGGGYNNSWIYPTVGLVGGAGYIANDYYDDQYDDQLPIVQNIYVTDNDDDYYEKEPEKVRIETVDDDKSNKKKKIKKIKKEIKEEDKKEDKKNLYAIIVILTILVVILGLKIAVDNKLIRF